MKMKARRILGLLAVSAGAALLAVMIYARFVQPETKVVEVPVDHKARYVNMPAAGSGNGLDVTAAVANSIDAVVHV